MLTITVHGTPVPQGSMKAFMPKGSRFPVVTSDNRKLKPWRYLVCSAAIEAMGGAGRGPRGPVAIDMIFTMPKPKSAPKQRITYPDRKPDIDKCIRSISDALVDAGAIEDDARIVCIFSQKLFPGEGDEALPVPGVVIRISEYPGDLDSAKGQDSMQFEADSNQ